MAQGLVVLSIRCLNICVRKLLDAPGPVGLPQIIVYTTMLWKETKELTLYTCPDKSVNAFSCYSGCMKHVLAMLVQHLLMHTLVSLVLLRPTATCRN